MTSSSEYLIDSNILVYFVHLDSAHHKSARRCVEVLEDEGKRLAYTPQNAAEFWAVCTKPMASGGLGYSVGEVAAHLSAFAGRFELLHETPHIYVEWQRVIKEYRILGRQVYDARLAATMRVAGIPKVLTKKRTGF